MGAQIVVDESAPAARCAGLAPAVRALHRAAAELPGSRVVVDQGSRLPLDYPHQTLAARVDAGALQPGSPLLAFAGDGFPHEGELPFLAARQAPALGVSGGRVVAAYLPEAGELAFLSPSAAARAALAQSAERVELPWTFSRTREEARAAEDALCARLAKDTDGFLARFDRRLSIALSRRLLPYPVTPNALTTLSLALALLGAWWLASGERLWQLAGVALLWACCILDGCDGEVARLKLLSSPGGAAYDLWVDHLSHLATFVGLSLGVWRARPDPDLARPAALLVSGFAACAFAVWRLVLSVPPERRGPHAALVERLASRDYVYLLLPLAALGRLEWFVWAAALGSHVFWLALVVLSARRVTPLPSSEA